MKTIIDYFEKTVREYPEKVAVADERTEITYDELLVLSRNTAVRISSCLIRRSPVVILMKRHAYVPAAMLGVLYSGNIYTVLDVDSPRERIARILDTLSPAAVIYDSEYEKTVANWDMKKIEFDSSLEYTAGTDDILSEIRRSVTSYDPAYVLFTSGSSGTPKGAVLTHSNVISYIKWFTETFNITERTVFGSQTPLYFSMSVSDLYGSLFTGAGYHMIPTSYFTFPAKLVMFLRERKINTIYWVPSAMGIAVRVDLFSFAVPGSIEKVLFAGETMPVRYLNYWRKHMPDLLYANLFGPTETTDICSYYIVDRDFSDDEHIPIGYACDGCRLLVLDEDGRKVRNGEKGELYAGGPFIAKGYYGQPERTRDAFVQDPLQNSYPDVMYRTGDLVYRNSYGELEYAGRKDFQIKHMGYRIEPGEVESAFSSVEGIDQTVCIHDRTDDVLILAYESGIDMDTELNEVAHDRLPHYMRPSVLYRMDAFPKNANGKINRKEIEAEAAGMK